MALHCYPRQQRIWFISSLCYYVLGSKIDLFQFGRNKGHTQISNSLTFNSWEHCTTSGKRKMIIQI